MTYYLIAGEASGDLHGANLMRGILKADPEAQFRFWGGDKMAQEGGTTNLVHHYREGAFMGFTQVIRNLGTIRNQMRECRADIAYTQPDVLILIDYAGFNLRMARFAREQGIRTFYYIAPKVWAWKESRVKLLKKYVDHLFVIFPFEQAFFRRHGIETIYEGNPLMDAIAARAASLPSREEFVSRNELDDRPLVALLSGSRRSEIGHNLPFMVRLSREFPQYQFVVAGVPWLDQSVYTPFLAGSSVRLVCDQTYELLTVSQAAVVTSGTATLETALIGTPEMVCYRSDWVTMLLGKALLKSKYISLVNLVLDRECVRELLQHHMNMRNATTELRAILPGGSKNAQMMTDYAQLRTLIGESKASERFGARMVELLKQVR